VYGGKRLFSTDGQAYNRLSDAKKMHNNNCKPAGKEVLITRTEFSKLFPPKKKKAPAKRKR